MIELFLYYSIIFIFGLVAGSFANVCIYRLPREKSIVFPGSHCTVCEHKIPAYLNIPLVSYIILKGRCKYCKEKINSRYPAVEIITAFLTLLWWVKFSFTITAFFFSVLGVLLIIVSFVDVDFKIIPPQCSYGMMVAGLIFAPYNSFLGDVFITGILKSFVGILAAGILLGITRFAGSYIFKKEALGLGDVKLLMGIGAFTGFSGVLGALFLGSFMGTVVGLGLRFTGKLNKMEYIPFGPYLALGSILYILFSELCISFILNPGYMF